MVLSCLSNICTEDIAKNIIPEVQNLLNSSKFIVRKKLFCLLTKMFLVYPGCISDFLGKLAERLSKEKNPQILSVLLAAIQVGLR